MMIQTEDKSFTYTLSAEEDNVIIGMCGDYRLWLRYAHDISVPPIYGLSIQGASIDCRRNNKHPADITMYIDRLEEILS